MADNDTLESGASAEGEKFRIPTLLRLLPSRTQSSSSAFAAASTNPLAEKGRVLSNLVTKMLELDDNGLTLQAVLKKTSNPALYDELALQLAEVRAEQTLCKARYDAIEADQPFSDPGHAAEDALLAAIRAVDIATANTASVNALLAASHQLVAAYAAKSTKK